MLRSMGLCVVSADVAAVGVGSPLFVWGASAVEAGAFEAAMLAGARTTCGVGAWVYGASQRAHRHIGSMKGSVK